MWEVSQFPDYLEAVIEYTTSTDWLKDVDGKRDPWLDNMESSLRERIERYANERVSAAMIDRAIDAAKLARLEKAVQAEVDRGYHSEQCMELPPHDTFSGIPCDCYAGRLKAALEP